MPKLADVRRCLPCFKVAAVVEDSQRLLGNYVRPSNCFTKQHGGVHTAFRGDKSPSVTDHLPLVFDYLTMGAIRRGLAQMTRHPRPG